MRNVQVICYGIEKHYLGEALCFRRGFGLPVKNNVLLYRTFKRSLMMMTMSDKLTSKLKH